MFIKKFYNSLSKEDKEIFIERLVLGLVWGIVLGLVLGLVGRLVWGIVLGLVGGLVWGIVLGLVWGLVWGLVLGLVGGLVWGIVLGQYGLNNTFILVLGIIVFVLMELMYYLANKDNKKNISLWNVLLFKIEELFEVLLVVINLLNIWFLIKKIHISWKQEYNEVIIKFLGYFGIIVIIVALFIGYLYINKWLITRKRKK